ncbi:MAG: hypothetical protein NUW37_18420 [Planctomycetes bacterium]|nr:hypothetical protein [Planctomycetota bacterium]
MAESDHGRTRNVALGAGCIFMLVALTGGLIYAANRMDLFGRKTVLNPRDDAKVVEAVYSDVEFLLAIASIGVILAGLLMAVGYIFSGGRRASQSPEDE